MPTEDPIAAPLAPRIVLISIASFWAFYFVIWSVRAMVIYHHHQGTMLGSRAIVSVVSAGLTVIFYLAMRCVRANRLGHSIGLALLLAVPAAIAYSAFNWYMFDHVDHGTAMQWRWSPASPADPVAPPAPLAPPALWPSVGAMPSGADDGMTPLQSIADQAGNGYFFFIAWAALYLALCYAAEIGALERRAAALGAAAQAAELRALRYQVNPHFLFNTLNSLSSLVLAGKREEAERMIINLATFFRTSLTGDPTEDVPLAEELRLQRLYLDIERVRFPDRLVVEIDVPDDLLGACVPGLVLQPLVENAVKYGVARARRAVTIQILAREVPAGLAITIRDDGDPIDARAITGGTGVGLRNVRDRLIARFGAAATCDWRAGAERGFTVDLVMPLIRHGC